MTKIWAFIRHNSGMVIGVGLVCLTLVWAYGCQSEVVSITNSPLLISRGQLDLEVKHFLRSAELRYIDLDQQDEFKRTFFEMAIGFMRGGDINPVAIALTLGNILGIGAVIDNVRKRTHINTKKGANGKVQSKSEKS